MMNRICQQCGKEFQAYECHVKRGKGKFCSVSCSVTYRNLTDNVAKRSDVRAKIKANHANVSGVNNPMYGVRGEDAPGYIDGRKNFGVDTYRGLALVNKPPICEICGSEPKGRNLHVHHKDNNHRNNEPSNLMIVCVFCHNNVLHLRNRDSKGCYVSKGVM